jgi:hypothetical protein
VSAVQRNVQRHREGGEPGLGVWMSDMTVHWQFVHALAAIPKVTAQFTANEANEG